MECAWKSNWEETKKHYLDFWNRQGLVVASWGPTRADVLHEETEDPGPAASLEQRYRDPEWRSKSIHWTLARSMFYLDTLPRAAHEVGPGSLALFLGSKAGLANNTVWYHPIWENIEEPERQPPLRFDPENEWWKIISEGLLQIQRRGAGRYMAACVDLIENIDTLASLRDNQRLLMDMAERPEWVYEKVMEINQVWFEAYRRIYDIIQLEDGSSAFDAFSVWGPGKTAKLQCDASAMFSTPMFRRFVAPGLREQAEWLDNSIFHLDGHQCIPHLDSLLEIEALDAIEWTPDPQVPGGGDPCWHEMYRRILDAGKCVQVLIPNRHDQIVPLLDAIGGKGVFLLTSINNEADAEKLEKMIAPYRI